ncbi:MULTISPECIES: glycosyltransferase 87 family protein [Streptomyces]|uniref:Glycosyltransferase 87 family protein n=1 Tax=Streptomyces sudanensis TaxID=436397 RepID=A0ABY4TA22_9ACTN|nr:MULTISPECIES: glycosyltransferase 87 family protein [Streptomyces]MCP9959282.1 glycosyltransferase 87 family protein [Streptomyces sudanensis]MCQ0000260.1 glycosyltransferase 87 family protein [Streptomyces sudanensis]URN15822.1 glycosyltransferase 87 family protein [Streptomyces sudanensis]
MKHPSGPRSSLVGLWLLSRAVLLLYTFRIVFVPGPDVTTDVSVIYFGWYEVLRGGTYPLDDVTWQYPPAAAFAILSPGLLPFLEYAHAFFVLALACDAVVFGLLVYAGGRPGKSHAGAWVWLVGVPLLGPTSYSRYDLMVTAVAVAALLAGARNPRTMGVLAGVGALLKVWPVLLLAGTSRGRVTRRSWTAAAVSGAVVLALCVLAAPGALAFLTFQRDRGTEVESLGAMVFHVARFLGAWEGEVRLNYGSVEFLGPYVPLVSGAAMVLTALAFGWLALWRLRAREFGATTPADAAFVAVLLFTTTSRVISPQYMLWLVGLAAVCLVWRRSRMRRAALLVLVATGVTLLEFPIWFSHVVASDALGLALLFVRNGLLVAASVVAARQLWRQTVTEPRLRAAEAGPARVPVQGGHRDEALLNS